ncbi:hypothetical protein, partial [Bacillus amyloliquefaciens]
PRQNLDTRVCRRGSSFPAYGCPVCRSSAGDHAHSRLWADRSNG